MYGSGLLKGLGVTGKHWFKREITEQYPEQRPDLPPASQGFFDYELSKCIACGLCERACPNNVITVETEKNEEGKKVVTGYTMKVEYCLFCGLCIEACPTKALTNANNFEIACYHFKGCEYDFLSGIPQEMNKKFNEVQADYWNKKRPEGNPVGMPEPVKPPKPAAKPAAKPQAKPADAAAAKPAEAAKPQADAKPAAPAEAEKPQVEAKPASADKPVEAKDAQPAAEEGKGAAE